MRRLASSRLIPGVLAVLFSLWWAIWLHAFLPSQVHAWNPLGGVVTGGGGGSGSVPSPAGHAGEYLKSDGSAYIWDTPSGGGDMLQSAWDIDLDNDVDLARGGTSASLGDPNANRLWGWDDAQGSVVWIAIGDNLSYDDATNTLSATGGTGGGYTDLTEFVDQTAWRLFYSDANGDVAELALGAAGEFLKSNGASAAPSWGIPSGAAHDPVTLGTDVDALLGIANQELTLDAQAANIVLAGPSSGLDADPSFRALVAADIPDLSSIYEGETHASEHAVAGADSVFPADPGADKFLKWNDASGTLEWDDPAGSGDMLQAAWDADSDGLIDLSKGGTDAALSDPDANRLMGWDDTDNAVSWITLGTNLSYDPATNTLSASGGGGSSTHTLVSKTANYTLVADDLYGEKTFTNTGAAAEVTLQLPGSVSSGRVEFLVGEAQYLKVVAATGESIRYLSGTTASGGYVRSNEVGTCWTLTRSGSEWVVTSLLGQLNYDQ